MKKFAIALTILITLYWLYANSLLGVNPQAKQYYTQLKSELKKSNYNPSMFVISGRRWQLDNYLLTQFNGAASKSKHKLGQAIDIIVLDINSDGKSDSKDVDIVYEILDKIIIQDKGGIGTYKKEGGFFNRQMVHFDCRGERSRWHR